MTDEINDQHVVYIPTKIYHSNGMVFVVEDIGAWQHTETGVFATGYWHCPWAPELPGNIIDVVIPYEKIEYQEMDYSAFVEHMAVQEAADKAAEEDDEPEDQAA